MFGPAIIDRRIDLTTAVHIGTGTLDIFTFRAFNLSGATIYLQLFNLNSAPTLGTNDIMSIPIIDGGSYVEVKPDRGPNFVSLFPSFAVGFGIGAATTPSGAVAAGNGVIVNIEYYGQA